MNKPLATVIVAILANVMAAQSYPNAGIDCGSVEFQRVPKEELFRPTSSCSVTPSKLLAKQLEPSFKLNLDVEKCSCQLMRNHNLWPNRWNRELETLFKASSYMIFGDLRPDVDATEFYQKLNSSVVLNKERLDETFRQLLNLREQLKNKFLEIYKPQDGQDPNPFLANYKLEESCKKLKGDHHELIYFLTGVESEQPQYFIKLLNYDENLFKLIINMNACVLILVM